jgi:hypothetical protein
MSHSTAPTNFYIYNSYNSSERLYTDGAGSNDGTRSDAVEQISFNVGDNLYFDGVGSFFYHHSYYDQWQAENVSSSYLDVGWYTGDGSEIQFDSSSVMVTQDMVDNGFYVTTSLDSSYSHLSMMGLYYDQSHSSESLMGFDFGAGSSMQPISSTLMPAGDGSGSDPSGGGSGPSDGYYVFSSADPSEFYYTDGAGDMGGARSNHVDSLTFASGDTLTFGGTDTLTYHHGSDGYTSTDSFGTSYLDINWYLGDGTQVGTDQSSIGVTQDMVNQGFYVSAPWDQDSWQSNSTYTWFSDSGMNFPVSDFGAGDSMNPLMAAGATPPPTDNGGDSSGGDGGGIGQVENHLFIYNETRGGDESYNLVDGTGTLTYENGDTLRLDGGLWDPVTNTQVDASEIAGYSGYINWYSASGDQLHGGDFQVADADFITIGQMGTTVGSGPDTVSDISSGIYVDVGYYWSDYQESGNYGMNSSDALYGVETQDDGETPTDNGGDSSGGDGGSVEDSTPNESFQNYMVTKEMEALGSSGDLGEGTSFGVDFAYLDPSSNYQMVESSVLVGGADTVILDLSEIAPGGYSYIDRSIDAYYTYDASGFASGDGSFGAHAPNTFILNVESDLDFFGLSYLPGYSDDSEVVILEGDVTSGTRTISLGESTDPGVEDWDVISFAGIDEGVSIDLSATDPVYYDVTATTDTGTVVAYVGGAEGVFGTSSSDNIIGDAARNILSGGSGDDDVSGGAGDDLISGGKGSYDTITGGLGQDILVDLDGGSMVGDASGSGTSRSDDHFVVGGGTTIEDFDLSPDGTGLSGRANQHNDIAFIQVTAASLAAAGFEFDKIYQLVSGDSQSEWKQFVNSLQVEVVADDFTDSMYHEIRLSVQDQGGTGEIHDLGSVSFTEHMTGAGAFNAVKMKTHIDEVLSGFESSVSDNSHVMEFFGVDDLTAAQLVEMQKALAKAQQVATSGDSSVAVDEVVASITADLSDETGSLVDQMMAAVNAKATEVSVDGEQDVADAQAVIDVAQQVLNAEVEEALLASEAQTSVFVPIAVEEIRPGTVRTEMVDRDDALDVARTLVLEREPDVAEPEASIVVLSNADDTVVSTAGTDDRYEVVPQLYLDDTDNNLSNQSYGDDVIIDIDRRSVPAAPVESDGGEDPPIAEADDVDDSGEDPVTAEADDVDDSGEDPVTAEADDAEEVVVADAPPPDYGDVVYLEGVQSINDVNFTRFALGREGDNSLKIEANVKNGFQGEDGEQIVNDGSVTVFKQFDAVSGRFAMETLEIASDAGAESEYWSLSKTEAVRDGGRIMDTKIVTDISETDKGILVGSSSQDDFVVVSDGSSDGAAEVRIVGFDSGDTIDLSAFGATHYEVSSDENGNSVINVGTSVKGADELEVSLTLMGITDTSGLGLDEIQSGEA